MRNRHLVDTAMFDISFSHEEAAFQAQSELESFIKREMMGVIDEVFEVASEAGLVMRIPSLEIDLGSVALPDYQSEWPRRLRERLTALLTEYSVSTSGGQMSGSGVIDRHQADYEQLEYFLLHGTLPWYSSLDHAPDLALLLDRALHDNALRLKKFLQSTAHRHQVLVRLVTQFPLQSITRLFHSIAPSHAHPVSALVDELRQAWPKNDSILDSIGLSLEKAMAQLWLSILELMLGQDSHQFSPRELLARALREMLFIQHKIEHKVLSEFILQTKQAAHTQSSSVILLLQQTLGEQTETVQRYAEPDRQQHDNRQAMEEGSSEQAELHDIAGAFKAAVESGDTQAIAALWEKLLTQHASLLERMLRRHGQRAQFRAKLAHGLTQSQLTDILALLEPREHAFVTNMIAQHERFRSRQESRARIKDQMIRQLWEFSLGYILVERGSRFDKKTYLASVLRQMAAWEKIQIQELLGNLLENENLSDHGAANNYEGEISDLFLDLQAQQGYDLRLMSVKTTDELEGEGGYLVIVALVGDVDDKDLHIRIFDASGDKVVDKSEKQIESGETLTALKQQLTALKSQEDEQEIIDGSSLSLEDKQEIIRKATSSAGHTPQQGGIIREARPSPHSKALREYLLYEQLHLTLANGVADLQDGEARLLELMVEIQRDYPWQLLRILRELQSSAINVSLISTQLSAPLLRKLLLAFLDLTNSAAPEGRSDLLDAVIVNAGRVKNQVHYFHQLLRCLIKGEFFDFEAIIASIECSADGGVTPDDASPAAALEPRVKEPALAKVTEIQAEQSLRQFLDGEIELSPAAAASIITHISEQLERQPLRMLQAIRLMDADTVWIARLVKLLPEHLLARIAAELAGQPSRCMLQVAELMTLACHNLQIGMAPPLLRNIKWEFIFTYLAATGRLFNENAFVQRYVETLSERTPQGDPKKMRSLLCQQLVANILPATQEVSLRIIECLNNPGADSVIEQTTETASIDSVGPAQAIDQEPHQEVYITNAGMVLAAPYLPRLFEMLGMTEKSAFKNLEAQLRAVHLLQYLVTKQAVSPEYRLFLNKLLCGVGTGQPIPLEIKLSGQEKELIDSLLHGMIENWKILGNTSVAGLRESFLQRQGKLLLRDEAWHLRVASKPFDMLLDQLPWGFKTIKYPWMERLIHVQWR